MSLRSLVSFTRRRPIRELTRSNPPDRRLDPAGVEPLERRVFLAADFLNPVADTFVRDPSFNQTNFGASPFLYVKTAGSGDNRIAYLMFDVGDWTAEQIGNATLYLTGALQTPTTQPITAAVFPVANSNWVEGNGTIAIRNRSGGSGGSQLTGTSPGDGHDTDNNPGGEMNWDNRPVISGAPISSARVDRESFQTYAFDLTGYIQQQRQAGNALISVAVQNLEATAHLTKFLSRDFGGSGRPQLVVTEANDPRGSVVRTAVTAPDVVTGGAATHTITVSYSGTAPIDVSSIDAADISVARDGGNAISVASVSYDPPFNSSSVTATYVLDAPGDTWEATDNDLYTIQVRRGEVRDVEGNDSVSSFNSFRARAFDSTAPTAVVNAAPITAGGASTYSFTVNYSDNILIDVATININNVSVRTPGGGSVTPRNVTFSPDGDSSQVLATYTIDAPGGDWGVEDNGNYTVRLHTQLVRDTAVNEVPEFDTGFTVAITNDLFDPTAAISAQDVTSAGSGPHVVTVLYSDDTGVNAGSIDVNDITVVAPGGGQLGIQSADVSPGGNGTPQTATYRIAPPAGGWTSDANGQYTITVQPGQVFDTNGRSVAGTATTFAVAINPPPPPDTVAPTASINPVNVTTGGGVIHAITVTFEDDVALDVSSFGPEDVTVTGPTGTLAVNGVQVNPLVNGTPISVTYQINAPGGTWDDEDDGAYVFTLNGGAARDTSGNVNAGVAAGFTVDIGGRDTSGPSPAINISPVTSAGGTHHSITIVFTDDGRVAANSIDESDIIVTRNSDGLVLAVTGVTPNPSKNASPITALYTVAAPGGTWDPSDDGTYTVTLKANAVADRRGNFAPSGSATFRVDTAIIDVTPPTATVAPIAPITTAGDTPLEIDVTYSDNQPIPSSVFDPGDLIVTGPNNVTLVPASATVIPGGDPNVVTVRYLFTPPGGAWDVSDTGTYEVTLAANAVVDAANNAASLAVPALFTVNVPAPSPMDPLFGGGNPVATNFVTEGVVAQPDGKLVLVGRRGIGGTPGTQGILQRRNADGTPDTTFGVGGEVVTDPGQGCVYYAVGLQSDGKIVVAGTMFGALDADFVIARFDTFGNLDPTFGTGGRTFIDFGVPAEAAYALAVGAEDKIVVGGSSGEHFAFARLTAAGIPDPTFGQGGKNLFDLDGVDVVGAVAIQRDGKVVAAGASGPNVVVIRLDINGERDFTFGSADRAIITVPQLASRLEAAQFADRSQALAIQRDDKILVGNFTAIDRNFGIVRIDLAGSLDPSFGAGGIASIDLGGNDDVDALLIQETGEILAVGTTDAGGSAVTAVVALDPSGGRIAGFGTNGVLTFAPAVTTPGRELKIGDIVLRAFGTRQADGRLVVTSSDRSPAQSSSSLRRLIVPGTRALPQGTLIGEFGTTAAGGRRAAKFFDSVTGATFIMKGGSGQAFRGDDGLINLVLTDAGRGVTVTVKGRGRVPLGDVICRGTIRSMVIKTGDLNGTMFIGGNLGKLLIGNVNGTIAVNGFINSIVADNLNQAKILSGANLGEDAELGGLNSNADAFGQGVIKSIKVKNAIIQSIVGAGLNPVDGVFGNDDDQVICGSALGPLAARSADDTSRFYASQFRVAKLPKRIKDIASDPRFKTA